MNARSEISIAGVLIGFCLLNYLYLIPSHVVAEGTSPVYPALVNSLLLCFSLAYLVEGIQTARRHRRQGQPAESTESTAKGTAVRPVAMLIVTGAWVLTIEQLGFLISTFLFLTVSSRIFGSKSWVKTLALGVIMPLVIYLIFWGLNSLLPEGPLEEMIRSLLKKRP